MANATSLIDFTIPLATFLATVNDDATIAAIISDLKVDRTGFIVRASGISVAMGQRYSNIVDDFMLKVYALSPGREDYTSLTTVGAVTANQVLATLDTNGQMWRIAGIVTARTATDAEVGSIRISGHFYRAAGTVEKLDPIKTVVATTALAGIDCDLDVDSDDVRVLVTGISAKTITWHIRIDHAEQIS